MIEIGLPSEEKQIGRWQKLLEAFPHTENRIVELVEKYPMHIREIDTTFKLARISAIIRSGNPSDAVHYIEDAIQRDKKSLPILFGKPV